MTYPKVHIEKLDYIDSFFKKNGYRYSAVKLVEQSKLYKTYEIPIAFIDLSESPFNLSSFDYFIFQMKRVENSDLKYPILFDNEGTLCDGWHRLAKAILRGDTTIKAIKLKEMPEYDRYDE